MKTLIATLRTKKVRYENIENGASCIDIKESSRISFIFIFLFFVTYNFLKRKLDMKFAQHAIKPYRVTLIKHDCDTDSRP